MPAPTPKFKIGQIVHHQKFGYRGVVFDIDLTFGLSDEWYEQVARSRPPKTKPWYRVLVHNSDHETYVAERHLEQAVAHHAPVHEPALAIVVEDREVLLARRLVEAHAGERLLDRGEPAHVATATRSRARCPAWSAVARS